MKTILFRFGITLSAVLLGVLLVSGMTIIGKESSGPIDDLLSHISGKVASIELEIILDDKEVSRSKSLKWFNDYRTQPKKFNKPSQILLGAYDNDTQESFESIVNLETKLNTVLPLIHTYIAWGSKASEEFPTIKVNAICKLGSTPVITWEPWLTSFESEKYPHLVSIEKRDINGMKTVANGDYDAYIKTWARASKKLEKPIFIRLGHEMNDPYRYPWGPQNNKPEDFVAAWKHVVNIFRNEGVKNVFWVWAPHPAYQGFDVYYPGDEYVDWIGTGTLNYGTAASWSQWWSFEDIFGKFYKQVKKYNKPVMITELGCLNVGGNRAEWFRKALSEMPEKYPLVKSVIFYHSSNDNTTTNKSLNWYIKDDAATTKAIQRAIEKW